MNTAIIVCPGPSFDPSDLRLLHELGDVFTVNRAILAYYGHSLRPRAAYFMDNFSAFSDTKGYALLMDPQIPKVLNSMKKASWQGTPNAQYLDITGRGDIENPFATDGIKRPLLTTLVAWQDLVRRGYQRVCLVGCDCGILDKTYFFDWAERPADHKRKRERYGMVYECLKRWAPYATVLGTATINLSPDSALTEILPTLTLGELLHESTTTG